MPRCPRVARGTLSRVLAKLRHRLAVRELIAPRRPDPAYLSRFGGLWTDRADAEEQIAARLRDGRIGEAEAGRLRHWVGHGHVVLEHAVEPAVCDRVRAELDRTFAQGDDRLLMYSEAPDGPHAVEAGVDTPFARVVDAYVFSEPARAALFSAPIVRFLRLVFDDAPLLFQSLTFERGSQQALHQDTEFVVTTSPLEFAGTWIALEDIRPGSGELTFLDGSHRMPEFLFSGRYKHFDEKRDGHEQQAEWLRHVRGHAERMGLQERRFVARKGDVLLWSADLAHCGAPVTDPSSTRKSLVGHLCPDRVDPFFFRVRPGRRAKAAYGDGRYASQYYAVAR